MPPPLVSVAAVFQQLVEDAVLFQGSEVGDVFCDDRDVAGVTKTRPLIIGQRAEQGIIFVCGKVVPVGVKGRSQSTFMQLIKGSTSCWTH